MIVYISTKLLLIGIIKNYNRGSFIFAVISFVPASTNIVGGLPIRGDEVLRAFGEDREAWKQTYFAAAGGTRFTELPDQQPPAGQLGNRFLVARKEQLRPLGTIPIYCEKPSAWDPMTMIDRRFPPDEEHHFAPEIIPPGGADGSEPESTFGVRDVERGSHRIYVTKIGRFGLLPFFLLGGIILIALLIFVLGAFLILIPVAGVVLAAAIIAGLLRGYPRWPH